MGHNGLEFDPSFAQWSIEGNCPEMPKKAMARVAILMMALGAKVQKDDTLDENSLHVLINPVENR